jgi:NAD(P)-dependent dehydrogenase (short-subunit alcohol dehydrogenase family)
MMTVALVTGGAKRLGRALHLAGRGYDLALHYHTSTPEAEATKAEIEGIGCQCRLLQGDLQTPDCATFLIEEADRMGGLSLVIHNASLFQRDTLETFTYTHWLQHQMMHAYTPLALARGMQQQQINGQLVLLLDAKLAGTGNPDFLTYTQSKAAAWHSVRQLAQALAPAVRVNGIAPGATLAAPTQRASHFEAQRAATMLEVGCNPEDIVQALDYLLDTPCITGQTLVLDGGERPVF